ncbi:MAG: acyltransferase [Panacagrimonas sp.]|jgi:1-acyl-sn-glycerol-3-phosphate acyltransferase|nr:acyltransferase [Panacagrimonas sp.]MCC2656072.1 acyltransferase [Panacagrimonas sp.]
MISVLLPAWLVGILTFTVMSAVLMFWGIGVLLPLALLRVLLPIAVLQQPLSRLMVAVAQQWVASNQLVYRVMHAPAWHLDLRAQLDPSRSYLLICNHQSWADIQILFDLFHGRTPFLRFFLKQELIWVPIVGMACWALDMPFMKRHSRDAIAANPALRREDLATTRQFCEKYRHRPITVVNFLEGTRFTEAKRDSSGSPYRHLLRPKSAGLSFTLNAMGEQFGGIIDVTLAYQPTTKHRAWSWLCGEQAQMAVHVDTLPIPSDLIRGDYEDDAEFRMRFQAWINGIWSRKDARLERMLSGADQPQMSTPWLT